MQFSNNIKTRINLWKRLKQKISNKKISIKKKSSVLILFDISKFIAYNFNLFVCLLLFIRLYICSSGILFCLLVYPVCYYICIPSFAYFYSFAKRINQFFESRLFHNKRKIDTNIICIHRALNS